MRWLANARALRRVRIWIVSATIAIVLGVIGTMSVEYGVHLGRGWFLSVGNGCVLAGFNTERLTTYRKVPVGVYSMNTWNKDWAFSWRPFRASDVSTSSRGATWNFAVLPLWHLAAVGLVLSGWTHGRLTMLRDSRTGACRSCGYDLTRVPEIEGRRICPECGKSADRESKVAA